MILHINEEIILQINIRFYIFVLLLFIILLFIILQKAWYLRILSLFYLHHIVTNVLQSKIVINLCISYYISSYLCYNKKKYMKTLEEKLEKVLERIDVLESKLGIKQEQKSDNYIGKWFNHIDVNSSLCALNNIAKLLAVEATREEVEESFIKEAKKRGFINGAIANNSSIHKSQLLNFNVDFEYYFYDEFSNELRLMTGVFDSWYTIFKNGIWADVIEVDKFAELKEAHKNGAIIQCLQVDGNWFDLQEPIWDNFSEYRIKPIEEPKVGDVCKFWEDNEDEYVVGILVEIDHDSKYYKYCCIDNWYQNAKVLTQEEVIKLLFKK